MEIKGEFYVTVTSRLTSLATAVQYSVNANHKDNNKLS